MSHPPQVTRKRSLARDPYITCEMWEVGKMSVPVAYEVRVVGRVGPAACEALTKFAVHAEPPATVLSGTLDQAALHGLLARIQALGFELVEVHRTTRRDAWPAVQPGCTIRRRSS
jgi:hypothetical protein